MTIDGYMVDISDPSEWNFTGTSVIPVSEHHLPRCSAFYIGGNTPHTWTREQIFRQENHYRLPIWVYNPGRGGAFYGNSDGKLAASRCSTLGMPKDRSLMICLDMETYIDESYTAAFHAAVIAAGYQYTIYESESVVNSLNFTGSLGVWSASWDGKPHIDAGAWATQYASSKMINHPFDISAVASFDHLWNIRASEKPPAPTPVVLSVDIKLISSDGGKTWAVSHAL